MVGTNLLDDKDGTIMPALARQYGNDAELINFEILRRWLQGKGIPDRTWGGLLGVLRVHCVALAENVEEALTAEEARPMGHPPPPSSDPWHCFRSLRDLFKRQPRPPHIDLLHPPHIELPRLSPIDQTDESVTSCMPSECPPLKLHSPVWYFKDYLTKFYSRPKDPVATWPPSPSEIFINLAIINREKVSTKELHQFMLATLDKGVDAILKAKAPVDIEQLIDTKLGIKQQCILVEGAPGVGKTTLSWEICKRWADGNLFQQYSLILLLRLRDEIVQNAKNIKDLVLYPIKERLEAIAQYLQDTSGTHTLILLEGLDELPKHLLTRPSIFTRLLSGTDLPDATILVTSRPSATGQLWIKWKERITRHIEILGFTEENITAYIGSILDPPEIPAFNTYLCTAPSIRQLMYIPLHSGIVVELYRMCRDTDKPLPTRKTALYARLAKTILTRHLEKHPTYKDDEIDVKEYTDLPDDIYSIFMDIAELAYNSVSRQQLIFKDNDKPIQHLGLMDAVAELFPLERKANFSYNFLHLSIQEYLGAVHISMMDTIKQEQLLESMCMKEHLKDMAMFIAAITKFKDMNWEVVKQAIQRECTKESLGQLTLSRYSMQIVYESENVNLLEGHSCYRYDLSDYNPLFDFTALGYCIATSTSKWALVIGSIDEYMQSTSGVDLLVQALSHHNSGSYTIRNLECWHKKTEVAEHLLAGLPHHTIPSIETLELRSEALQPLPPCLPGLIHRMNKLRKLVIYRATAATLADTLQVLATTPTSTLERLHLSWSQFSPPIMEALRTVLKNHNKSVAVLKLRNCGLNDNLACLLATPLLELPELRDVYLGDNAIEVKGRAELDKYKITNKQLKLHY